MMLTFVCHCLHSATTSLQKIRLMYYSNELTSASLSSRPAHEVLFKYTGNTFLMATGSVTGKRYRFNFPGDMQPIDSRDAAALSTIPVMKKMQFTSKVA